MQEEKEDEKITTNTISKEEFKEKGNQNNKTKLILYTVCIIVLSAAAGYFIGYMEGVEYANAFWNNWLKGRICTLKPSVLSVFNSSLGFIPGAFG